MRRRRDDGAGLHLVGAAGVTRATARGSCVVDAIASEEVVLVLLHVRIGDASGGESAAAPAGGDIESKVGRRQRLT